MWPCTPPPKKTTKNNQIATLKQSVYDYWISLRVNTKHCKHNTVNCGVRVKISSLRILPKLGVDLYGGYNTFNTEL